VEGAPAVVAEAWPMQEAAPGSSTPAPQPLETDGLIFRGQSPSPLTSGPSQQYGEVPMRATSPQGVTNAGYAPNNTAGNGSVVPAQYSSGTTASPLTQPG